MKNSSTTPTRNPVVKDKTSPPPCDPSVARNALAHRTSSADLQTPPRSNCTQGKPPLNNTNPVTSLAEENSFLRDELLRMQAELSQWREQALLFHHSASSSPAAMNALPSSLYEAAQDSGMLWNGSGPAGPKHRRRVMKPSTSWSTDEERDIDTPEVSVVKGEQPHSPSSRGSGLHRRNLERVISSSSSAAAIMSEEGKALLKTISNTTNTNTQANNSNFDHSHHHQHSHHHLESTSTSECNPQHMDDLNQSFRQILLDRGLWLVALLCLQSLSSFILKHNEMLLQRHVIIVRFLTMLVGAGGNAGNQASVRVIRGLATGSVDENNVRPYFWKEMRTGLGLSVLLGIAGCIRAAIFFTPPAETLAITTSLFSIVMISIILGTLLPFLMRLVHVDPAHSSTTIQVIMDILGVAITVRVCAFVLESELFAGLRGDDDAL